MILSPYCFVFAPQAHLLLMRAHFMIVFGRTYNSQTNAVHMDLIAQLQLYKHTHSHFWMFKPMQTKDRRNRLCCYINTCTCLDTFLVGYLSLDVCSTVNDRIDSLISSFAYLYSSHSLSTLIFISLLTVFFKIYAECLYVCQWVPQCVIMGREGEACLFQGTPPELMFHTCAQCSTLYRASQVHCINCGRNHFIVGVVLPFHPSGMDSITQYSHLNCF